MRRRKKFPAKAESFGGSLEISSAAASPPKPRPKKMGMSGPGMMGGKPMPVEPDGGTGGKPVPLPTPIPDSKIWQIDFINNSNTVKDSELKRCIDALQIQVSEHFAPVWKMDANLTFTRYLNFNPTVFILDTSSDVSILGYHDMTQAGIPVGFVFAKSTENSGEDWEVTASHEVLEMIADPYVNLAVQGQFVGQTVFFAYENCDAVQGDVYYINDVPVSNFQYPQWFVNLTGDQYDYMGVLDAPFTLSPGGYLTYFRTIGDWIDVTANGVMPLRKAKFSRHWQRRANSNPNYKGSEKTLLPTDPHQSPD